MTSSQQHQIVAVDHLVAPTVAQKALDFTAFLAGAAHGRHVAAVKRTAHRGRSDGRQALAGGERGLQVSSTRIGPDHFTARGGAFSSQQHQVVAVDHLVAAAVAEQARDLAAVVAGDAAGVGRRIGA